jgi:enoyl-CoA hydratase
VVAALNGHTIAGGCMIALACDRRLMAEGKGKISLNEVSFGASVFAGCVEMLRNITGNRTAEKILLSGDMYSPEQALRLGLVDRVCPPGELREAAVQEARDMAARDGTAFESIKKLIREPVAGRMRSGEEASIREFADIWYSEATWKRLEKIEIRKG